MHGLNASVCVCTFMSLCVNLTAQLNNEWLINDCRAQRASRCPVAYYGGSTQPAHDIHTHLQYTHTLCFLLNTCFITSINCTHIPVFFLLWHVKMSSDMLTMDYYHGLCINLPFSALEMKQFTALLT